jgi:hypothetical protein
MFTFLKKVPQRHCFTGRMSYGRDWVTVSNGVGGCVRISNAELQRLQLGLGFRQEVRGGQCCVLNFTIAALDSLVRESRVLARVRITGRKRNDSIQLKSISGSAVTVGIWVKAGDLLEAPGTGRDGLRELLLLEPGLCLVTTLSSRAARYLEQQGQRAREEVTAT